MEEIATKRMIEKGQIIKIHTLKNALKMDDDEYRKLIHVNFYPAISSKELSFAQAEIFIENLKRMAVEKDIWKDYKGKDTYEELSHREGMAAPKQLRMIEALWKGISKDRSVEKRKKHLRGWLNKYFGVSDLRFLDDVTVHRVIHALKQMHAKKNPESPEGYFKVMHDRSMAEL
jgi:hypothetical protein